VEEALLASDQLLSDMAVTRLFEIGDIYPEIGDAYVQNPRWAFRLTFLHEEYDFLALNSPDGKASSSSFAEFCETAGLATVEESRGN